jgi:dihydroorotase-like cyclic amidohydrolase
MSLQGEVVTTISAGRLVFSEGEILAERGSGRFIAPD